MAQRLALLIANNEYDHPPLQQLTSPINNVTRLATILADPAIGNFSVSTLINESLRTVQRAVTDLLRQKKSEDVILIYFSGHGILNSRRVLHLALKETEEDYAETTGLRADFIREQMDASLSERIILILDCCYGAAFDSRRTDSTVLRINAQGVFEGKGYGRIILTASDRTSFGWDAGKVQGISDHSVFTQFLIQGLGKGEADRNNDGIVTTHELFSYLSEQIAQVAPQQRPQKFTFGNDDLEITKNPFLHRLAEELRQAIQNTDSYARRAAAEDLKEIVALPGSSPELIQEALASLRKLAQDPNEAVARKAEGYLALLGNREANTDTDIAILPGAHKFAVLLLTPVDVASEMRLATQIMRRLNRVQGLREPFFLELVSIDDAHMQNLMESSPSGVREDLKLILCIFWGQTALGAATQEGQGPAQAYSLADYWDMLQRSSASQQARLLVYRRTSTPLLDPRDPQVIDKIQQVDHCDRLEQQIRELLAHTSRGVHKYNDPEDLLTLLERHLRDLIDEMIPSPLSAPVPELETIQKLQAMQVQPGSNGKQWLGPYLEWLVRKHTQLELRGIREVSSLPTVPLEKVYVALKGDRSSAYERFQARDLLEADLEAVVAQMQAQFTPDELAQELAYFRRQILVENPLMLSLRERDRPETLLKAQVEVVTLGEAFQHERWLVILGDPGSGKTTLARWLTVKLARAMIDEAEEVRVAVNQIDPEQQTSEATTSLGNPRLPVLLRIADFAEAYERSPLRLIDYLGYHPWLGEAPAYGGELLPPEALNALIRDYLRRGEAVVMLDGMDEITGSSRREDIVRAIETFIKDWINGHGAPRIYGGIDDGWHYPRAGTPLERGGNQIIITSRIAGYHASPIHGPLTHVTIEPMGRRAVEHFCDSWMAAIYELIQPRVDAETRHELATEKANRLKQAIYDPQRPRVRELASNPLLVTILAVVFLKRGQLPQQRAELYKFAFEILVEDWRKTDLSAEELSQILAPLAAHIHQKYATGLIQDREMRTIITRHLHALPRFQSSHLAAEIKVEEFLQVVREDVGILAARGEKLYGFLHLTFQEYLAALHLVTNQNRAAEEIIQRIDDPRWREPILLALSHMSRLNADLFEELLQNLLAVDDPIGDLLPRTPLLIVAAMDEISAISEAVVQEIARRLLYVYANHERLEVVPQLRERLEAAFLRLRRDTYAHLIDAMLEQALMNPPASQPELAVAAATLIDTHNWLTPALVHALMQALPYDREQWNWPMHRVLHHVITPSLPADPPQPPKGLTESEWRDLKQTDPDEYRQLQMNVAIAEAAYQEQKARYERERQRQPVTLPLGLLPFKQELLDHPNLVERIQHDPDWLRIVVALYGGYYNYEAHQTLQEYQELANFLQKPDGVRETELARKREYYIGRWGAGDTIYNIAVYLDSNMGGRLQRVRLLPVFEPEAIYRDSALTPLLRSALHNGKAGHELIPLLWQRWENANDDTTRIDALTALALVGEDVIPAIEHAIATSNTRPLAQAVLTKCTQISYGLSDAVVRAISARTKPEPGKKTEEGTKEPSNLLAILGHLQGVLSPQQWIDIFTALVRMSNLYNNQPLLYQTFEQVSDERARRHVAVEYWVYRLLGGPSDDLIYDFAVALDKIAASDPYFLCGSLNLLARAQNRQWQGYRTTWEGETLPPRWRDQQDLPLEVMDAIERIRSEAIRPGFLNVVRSVFLDAMVKLTPHQPDLIPELLLFNRVNIHSGERVEQALLTHLPAYYPQGAGLDALIEAIPVPYYRARALLRLARQTITARASLLTQVVEVADQIMDPHQRCRVYEYLMPYLDGTELTKVLEAAVTSAYAIVDPDDKVRALVRLAQRLNLQRQHDLLQDTLDTLSAITDEHERAETLHEIRPLLAGHKELAGAAIAQARTIVDPWSRARALGMYGHQLNMILDQLQHYSGTQANLWIPVVLGLTIQDLLGYFNEETGYDRQWQAVSEGDPLVTEQLYLAGMRQGLTLTRVAAQSLDAHLQRGHQALVHRFLPLMQHATPDALAFVEGWVNYWWDEAVANHAALLLAEQGRQLNAQTIHGLLRLIRGAEDRSRIRAALVLHGEITVIKRERRFFRASELGAEVFEALASAYLQLKDSDPGIAVIVAWTYADILYDSPKLIEQWVTTMQTEAPSARQAEVNLSHIRDLTVAGGEALKAAFGAGHPGVQRSILLSLCRFYQSENSVAASLDLEPWIRTVLPSTAASIEGLPLWPNPIIAATQQALDLAAHESLTNQVTTAEQALESSIVRVTRIIETKTQSEITTLFQTIGDAKVYLSGTGGSIFKHRSEKYALLTNDIEASLPLLVTWLATTLRSNIQDDGFLTKRSLLLVAVAIYASEAPSTFVNLARKEALEPLLAAVIRHHDWVPGRVAAIKLIEHIDKLAPDTIDALQHALYDVQDVQRAAVACITRLRHVEGSLIDRLIENLEHESTMRAYTSVRLLTVLGRSEYTPAEQRRRIVTAIARVLRTPRAQRGIYEMEGDGNSEDNFFKLGYLGRLDQALFQALIDMTQVL